MKIRTDFVTNSSSSSFTLVISIDLVDGERVQFKANGGTGESGRVNYFDEEAIVKVSPQQLGKASSVDELIELLQNGVFDGYDEKIKVFDQSRPVVCEDWDEDYDEDDYDDDDYGNDDYDDEDEARVHTYDAYDFIVKIREKIQSMDQIEKISITGDEENTESYYRTYSYNLKAKSNKYTGEENGSKLYIDGSHGGDLRFSDLNDCNIQYDE